MMSYPRCRHCGAEMPMTLVDLGLSAVANSYVPMGKAGEPEPKYPLHVRVCESCWLVQVDEDVPPASIFNESSAYFSSFSDSWLAHARAYADAMADRLHLGRESLVIEIASNDGYLLKNFAAKGIPVLGIEPSGSVAAAAEKIGVPTLVEFFGERVARRLHDEGRRPDLICSANVLAHVPDINDFVAGLAIALAQEGTITVEFPHLMRLVAERQFDTVYHEHFSYLSLHTARRIFAAHDLRIWDVEELPTHGGSLRLWACHDAAGHRETPAVASLLAKEASAGMLTMDYYGGFQALADRTKNAFLSFLLEAKRNGRTVIGYGAAAKGNTLLNYAGARPDLIDYVADASPHKQGRYLPGSRIPVVDEARIRETRPDCIVIFPWNLRDEITAQLAYVREWGGQFVTAIPEIRVD